jgi:hypothetical protein
VVVVTSANQPTIPCATPNRRMRTIRMLLLIILGASVVTACGGTAAQQPTPFVVIDTTGPEPTPTPPVCTALPVGMSLIIEPISPSEVRLSGEGFQPGEPLTIVMTSEDRQHRGRIEFFPAEPVGADGHFTIIVDNVHRVRGATTNVWQVALIHARGAACQTVTLPKE